MSDTGAIATAAVAAPASTSTTASSTTSVAPLASPGTLTQTQAAPQGAPELFEVKVDGKVERMTKEQLLQAASLGKAGFQRMEQAQKMKAQAEAFLDKFRKDPMAALEDPTLGISEDKRRDMLEQYYKKKYIDRDKMTPEQIELERAKQELQKYKEAEEAQKQKELDSQKSELQNKWRDHYQKVIIEALEHGGLPKTQYTVARMAFYMQHASKNKIEIPMEMIVDQVRSEYQNSLSSFSQNATPEALVKFLGPDLVKKLQKYGIEEHKKKLGAPPAPTNEPSSEKKKPLQRSDWNSVNKYWTRNG